MPPALVAVIVKGNVPSEGVARVETVRVAETPPVDGTARLEGASVNDTFVGTVPLQSALNCTMSLPPLTDRKVICEDFCEERISDKDEGEAEATKSRLPVITTARFTDLDTPPELVPVIVKV